MKNATGDNILYLTIALSIVGILGLVSWYQDAHGLPIRMPISDRVAAVVITTAVVFGFAIRYSRKLWSSTRVWILLCVAVAVYLPLQWWLVRLTSASLGLNCLLAFVELFLMLFLLERLVPYFKPHRRDSEAVK